MQTTDTQTSTGGNPYNNPVQIYAHAREVRAPEGAFTTSSALGLSAS
jgi:hypothetical protein